jgi:hypothetical protein
MAGFALSCFGLLLFLWIAFGGNIPLKPKGYRFTASFSEATQLAQEADVRISGVPVGKVKTIEPDKKTGAPTSSSSSTRATRRCRRTRRRSCARRRCWARPTSSSRRARRSAKKIPEGGRCASRRFADRRARRDLPRLRHRTRDAFGVWMQTQAQAITGHGRDVNEALGNLGPFAEDASKAVDILNRQQGRCSG